MIWKNTLISIIMTFIISQTHGQITLQGNVIEEETGDPVIGANVVIKGTIIGVVTDFEGDYLLNTDLPLPFDLQISYTGYNTVTLRITDPSIFTKTELSNLIQMSDVIVVSRIPDKHIKSPIVIVSLDEVGIRASPSLSFYEALGQLPEVDNNGSIGFRTINMRGFNSTSPIRSLQIIDGVDNQAPGLNFSLGNFLGISELDVLGVDIIVGASGAYYGPNAFNGVISMQTKNPFHHTGFSAMMKAGERNLLESAVRFADVLKNKNGHDFFAYKLNLFAFRADDWRATNYNPITASRVPASNPGRFDAVNIYGDEYYSSSDFAKKSDLYQNPGIGNFYRIGYKESELVDNKTSNYKTNVAFHLRTKPSIGYESPEIILSSNFGSGTTVYQGDNRFSLRDITFFQHRIELQKRDKYFIRAYYTHEDAGNSFDPYFTALRLQQLSKSNQDWSTDYSGFWRDHFPRRMKELGYPMIMVKPDTITFDFDAAEQWLISFRDTLANWHMQTAEYANSKNDRNQAWVKDFLVPGTEEFNKAFNDITARLNNESGGTRFFDRSSLFHSHGEYSFTTRSLFDLKVGGNYRLYAPQSKGTIFSDTAGTRIRNSEIGVYAGTQKKLLQNKLISSFTLRLDKNQNFNWIYTPAATLVYASSDKTFLRFSLSSAIRNPTLTDQYLYLNVGPAILSGHTQKVDSLITIDSFKEYLDSLNPAKVVYFDIDAIRPEKVRTIEFGLRTRPFDNVYVDLGYYRSTYKDFLGYLIGLKADIGEGFLPLPDNVQPYRYSANSATRVNTQGFSIGINYYPSLKISLNGNYSFNELRKLEVDDPIIPAYNTPRHKFNLGITGHDIKIGNIGVLQKTGFGIHYKWVEGFHFEGSPQFTGFVPSYGQLNVQISAHFETIKTSIKAGATNVLNNQHFEAYGSPTIGRLAYIGLSYNF